MPVPAEAGDGAIEPAGQTLGGHERVASSRGVAGLLVAAGGESGIRFRTKPGTNNLVRIQGTSTIHDWEIRGRILLGSFEAGRGFGLDHTGMGRGRVDARANLNIPVKSLMSVKQDGSPYSYAMDSTMHEKLLMESHPTIEFTLTELTRVESAEGEPLRFESRGNLAVAGVEREVEVPVSVVLAAESVHFSGELSMKMSDFGIEPPSIGDGTLVKIADEVTLSVEWTLERITK